MTKYKFRPFLNSDPPGLVGLWNSQPSRRCLVQPMTAGDLEQSVFSKVIFDRQGLILAMDDTVPAGFVHAGLGPTSDKPSESAAASTPVGVLAMVMVRCADKASGLGVELVQRGEDYLRTKGVSEVFAGGVGRANPFYCGLCGSSARSGVFDSDPTSQELYHSCGYETNDRVRVMHCDLSTFRPRVSRQQLQLHRTTRVDVTFDSLCASRWSAMTFGHTDCTRFDLILREGGPPQASVTFWNLQPLARVWGGLGVGMIDLEVSPTRRRQGLATCLLAEAFCHLQRNGVMIIEAQVSENDSPLANLCESLGFVDVDRGEILHKTLVGNG